MRNGPNKSEIADINASVLNRSHNRGYVSWLPKCFVKSYFKVTI